MRIESGSNVSARNLSVPGGDKIIEQLQKQIKELEEHSRELMANDDIPSEIKQEQKQAIDLQIAMLRQQISKRQRELQQERSKAASSEKNTADADDRDYSVSMSGSQMLAVFSADTAMTQIKAKESVRVDLASKARTAANEIATDASHGVDVKEKLQTLSEIEARISGLTRDMAQDVKNVQEAYNAAEDDERKAEEKDEDRKDSNGRIDTYV